MHKEEGVTVDLNIENSILEMISKNYVGVGIDFKTS